MPNSWSRAAARLICVSLLPMAWSPAARADAAADRALAWGIAAQNLFLNTVSLPDPADPLRERSYLLAGGHQFHTLWTRDFSLASTGALIAGADTTVRDSLEVLLAGQRADGLIPRTVDSTDIDTRVILGVLGIVLELKNPLKPWFETEYHVVAIDSNVWVPWAASRYVARTHDLEFARKWFAAVERAFAFLEKDYVQDDLVSNQPPFSDWADSVRRTGRVAFTTIGYILALRGAADWAAELGLADKAREYRDREARVTAAFRAHFWDPERKMVRNFDGDDRLSADANLMAVAYHVLPREESLAVMQTLRASPLWRPMPGRATWPDYPSSLKGKNVKLVGIASYHDSMVWLWITALAAEAESAVGNCAGYEAIIDALSQRIARDGTVYEVFDIKKHGRLVPVWRPLYRSETPFTWSSGMYLEAVERGCAP